VTVLLNYFTELEGGFIDTVFMLVLLLASAGWSLAGSAIAMPHYIFIKYREFAY
jgi:hypothetical protein